MKTVNIIIPAKNEQDSIRKLLQGIKENLSSCSSSLKYNILVVDDSTDKTAKIAISAGAKVLKGRGLGLAQAVLDGIDTTDGDYIIVMDADGQHPFTLISEVIEKLNQHDLVVVTKHAKGATADFSLWRKIQSSLAVWLTHVLIPVPVSDPMSGFFGIRRSCINGIPRGEYIKVDNDKVKEANLPDDWKAMNRKAKDEWYLQNGYAVKLRGLEAIGFKIGLELFTKAKWVSHAEIPMAFGKREAGMSKGTRNALQKHLWHLFTNSLNYEVELPKGSEEYHNFYEANGWQKEWKQDIAKILKSISYELKPKDTLDVGCGSSPNINYLYGNRVGIDINEKAIEFMKSYSDANFQEGSILDIPFFKESFDMVTCIEVVEHLYPNDAEFGISELARVLAPKGHLILATPNYNSLFWNIVETLQRITQPGHWTSDHHTKFNRKTLSELCQKHGLKEVKYNGIQFNMDMVITYQKI